MNNPQPGMQLVKEFRPILLPWIGAVIAGSLIVLKPLVDGVGLETLLIMVVSYGFLGGLALVPTMVFGQEVHDRTLSLLLVQPVGRSRIWRQKMLVAAGAVIAGVGAEVALLAGISTWYPGGELWEAVQTSFRGEQLFLSGVFLVATVCSSGFWTLEAGSIVGGVVFATASQLVTALALVPVWERIRSYDDPFRDPLNFIIIGVMGLIYSGLFLWLGWRKFVRLELRDARSVASGNSSSLARRWPARALLGSRPESPVLNLVRKEIWLQKPIAQLAGAFVVFWCGVVVLQRLRPNQDITYLFDVVTCLFAPVSALLAGCISLGEERSLNLSLSQMALPFSAPAQWLLKLLVSLGTAAVLSLGLPILLFAITGGILELHGSGLMNPKDEGILGLGLVSALMFLLGFWASTLSGNTVRAAIVAIVGVITLPALALLGIYWGTLFLKAEGIGSQNEQIKAGLWITAAGALILMLSQSLIQFRRWQGGRSQLLSYSLLLAGVVLFVAVGTASLGFLML
ncbi:MAG TPA: hypothetical protein VKY92_01760 [Verrucomicrobiae bacterium]|nr:hypothetical protein [Verrucomicrobiae bacterium]